MRKVREMREAREAREAREGKQWPKLTLLQLVQCPLLVALSVLVPVVHNVKTASSWIMVFAVVCPHPPSSTLPPTPLFYSLLLTCNTVCTDANQLQCTDQCGTSFWWDDVEGECQCMY